MKYLVLDLETIPDRTVWTPPDDDPTKFPPPYAHEIVCLGYLEAHQERGALVFDRLDSVCDDEHTILSVFTALTRETVKLITWNGRCFDLPVLMQRSMKYGIPRPWYYSDRDMRYRYSEDSHLDLADAIGDYGASARLSLDGMAKLIGLPGKFGDVNGGNVSDAIAAGRHSEVASYCEMDVAQTALLWLRWLHHKGALDKVKYQDAVSAFMAKFSGAWDPEFKDRIDFERLTLT